MPGLVSPDIEALRQKIAALEKRPMLAEGAALLAQRVGNSDAGQAWAADPFALLAAPAGLLQEIFADEQRQAGAALGFTLGLAKKLITRERQAILYLQLQGEMQELGLPFGPGAMQFGLDQSSLVIGRIETITELLWAMEEAIACRAVAAVVADLASHPKALDFTASRRLSLRAAAAGTSTFLLRYGRGREASAAKLRWRVSPALSGERAFDPRAPGPPRFQIEIEKGRLGEKSQRAEGRRLLVDWTENGFVSVEPVERIAAQPRRTAAAPLPLASPLGDRLSQAG
jgi:protein ImuA